MRLLDQVAQARMPVEVTDAAGTHRFVGADAHAPAVETCPLRFVIDGRAAEQCFALLASDRGMLTGENRFLRAPATSFWLEWPCAPADGAGSRTGLLVEADPAGRAGRVTTFWEQAAGEPVVAQATIWFDLDGNCAERGGHEDGFVLSPGTHSLSSHLLFRVDPAWLGHFLLSGEEAALSSAREIAADLVPGIEFLFAFSTLLAERACFDRHDVELARLNRRRARLGKPPLLDHVEVRLDLASSDATGRPAPGGASRQVARLHHVRGHMVRRSDLTFWRRSHLRGDAARLVRSKTVSVTRR